MNAKELKKMVKYQEPPKDFLTYIKRKESIIDIEIIKEIIKLSKKPIAELRKLNPERAYAGKELTKEQLIYQIVFLRDAPNV